MPTCSKCKETKAETEFYRQNKRGKPGYQSYCKTCANAIHYAYTQTDRGKESVAKTMTPERRKAIQDKFDKSEKGRLKRLRFYVTQKYRDLHIKSAKKYRENNTEKVKAQSAIAQEVATGRMPRVRTLICDICKENQAKHYHHWSYEPKHWLDVIPVCPWCHIEIHK